MKSGDGNGCECWMMTQSEGLSGPHTPGRLPLICIAPLCHGAGCCAFSNTSHLAEAFFFLVDFYFCKYHAHHKHIY